MTRYRILSWGGIPAQLKVFGETGRPRSLPLADWFMQEIDRVAMSEGIVGNSEYLERWKWTGDLERPGTPEEVAAAVSAELEAEWIPVRRTTPPPEAVT
jgi:hypothetical protein